MSADDDTFAGMYQVQGEVLDRTGLIYNISNKQVIEYTVLVQKAYKSQQ